MCSEGAFVPFLVAFLGGNRKILLFLPKLGLAFIAISDAQGFVSACCSFSRQLQCGWLKAGFLGCSHSGSHSSESSLCVQTPALSVISLKCLRGLLKEGSHSSTWTNPVLGKTSSGDLSIRMAQSWKVKHHTGKVPDCHNVLLLKAVGLRAVIFKEIRRRRNWGGGLKLCFSL